MSKPVFPRESLVIPEHQKIKKNQKKIKILFFFDFFDFYSFRTGHLIRRSSNKKRASWTVPNIQFLKAKEAKKLSLCLISNSHRRFAP
jgi:hypothetical protein